MTKTLSAAKQVAPAVQQKPYTIQVSGYTSAAFAEAAVHVRAGYIFRASDPIELFSSIGQCTINLELGTPETHATEAANATSAHYVELQRIEFQKEVAAMARQMIEDDAKVAQQKRITAEIDAQREALKVLEASLKA